MKAAGGYRSDEKGDGPLAIRLGGPSACPNEERPLYFQ
jgi:hypothetical protein